MKACPKCGRLYPEEAGFCPVDGGALSSATQVPIALVDGDKRVGQLLNERYQIRRVVADGGMGRVYEALDLVERRNVAVKILHGDVARDPVQVERFKREFEVSNLLPHEYIAEVVEFSELKDGSYALVMEFLFGEELSHALEREKFLHPGRIVRMISQVALGLDQAHEKKLVHRDLKPDNIFLCQTPEGDIIKVLDFGSVKDKTAGAKKLTVMGTTIGSPFYMSPEQAQGLDTLDHRADVWALGGILFECMAGKVPFYGVNGPQILLSILTKEAPNVSEVEGVKYPVPPGVDVVLQKAFKKTASLRHESVGALADAIGHAYGLKGNHIKWATTPESELTQAIDGQMQQLLSAPRQEVKRTVQDDFFGEGDSLGEVEPPPPSQDAMAQAMRAASGNRAASGERDEKGSDALDEDSFGVPGLSEKQGLPLWVWAAGVVLLGVLIVLLAT